MDYEKKNVVDGLKGMRFQDMYQLGNFLQERIAECGESDINPSSLSFILLDWAEKEEEKERMRKKIKEQEAN